MVLSTHDRGRTALDSARPNRGSFELIGYSVQGRPLVVQLCGNPASNFRIFILGGQHGDESDARESASTLLSRVRSGAVRAAAHLAILIDANPDGAAMGTRRNASHVDLNRDNMLLSAPETLAIHNFVDRWRPDLIFDVHTYCPWRRELLKYDFVFPHDVMIDFPTNPAVQTTLSPALQEDLLEFAKQRMAELSIRCDRYTRVRPPGIPEASTYKRCEDDIRVDDTHVYNPLANGIGNMQSKKQEGNEIEEGGPDYCIPWRKHTSRDDGGNGVGRVMKAV